MDEFALLKAIVAKQEPHSAPVKTERYGDHVEFLVAIGKDETATVTMTREGYDKLIAD